MNKEIEIPEGCEARIEGNKVIIEQKESEDERIRKEIIAFLKHYHTGEGDSVIYDDAWIAYLEKQKEQQPLMCDGEIEDRKRDIVAAIRKYYPADYAEYLTSFLKGLSLEDNSEDEYGQEMLGIAYKLMYEHIPENLRTQGFWDSLKFMREYTGKVAIMHSYEKSAEWSEEDESYLQTVIGEMEASKKEALEYEHKIYDAIILWLKSFHERFNLQPKQRNIKTE